MPEIKCGECAFKAKYDKKPSSIPGRLWRWHINWCPGWKAYMESLDPDKKKEIAEKYNWKMKK
ncbi:MAG: hypothetical protein JW864_00820 [Spirochaetes bacterium]|nr:hypothetical protein [Spirochaetota bacterium]